MAYGLSNDFYFVYLSPKVKVNISTLEQGTPGYCENQEFYQECLCSPGMVTGNFITITSSVENGRSSSLWPVWAAYSVRHYHKTKRNQSKKKKNEFLHSSFAVTHLAVRLKVGFGCFQTLDPVTLKIKIKLLVLCPIHILETWDNGHQVSKQWF